MFCHRLFHLITFMYYNKCLVAYDSFDALHTSLRLAFALRTSLVCCCLFMLPPSVARLKSKGLFKQKRPNLGSAAALFAVRPPAPSKGNRKVSPEREH